MTDPIQQQLIAARKTQILEAAASVFAEKGFHPTTIKDIAKQAGIAEGTIYNYFDSKPALLLGIFEQMKATIIQENLPLVSNLPNAPNEIEFRSFIRSFLQFPLTASKQDNFALFRIVLSEMLVNAELRTLYYQQILEPTLTMAETHFGAQAAKRGLNPSNASLTIRAISSMVMGLMLMRIMGDPLVTDQWEKLPDLLTDLILNGLKDNES